MCPYLFNLFLGKINAVGRNRKEFDTVFQCLCGFNAGTISLICEE
jgi:hypothetical protein